MTKEKNKTFFAPQLFIKSGCYNIDFYIKGMGAVELRRWSNDDGSIHVAELSIEGCIFHLHEENPDKDQFEPIKNKGVTALIGLFVEDVDKTIEKAVNEGAVIINSAQDYDYGYRQGEIKDPFGHVWLIQKKIS
ncbi:MAG: VOC family protein [Chitinophagaceae bacterium]